MTANNDKRIPAVNSIVTYAYRTIKDLACKKEEIKCNNIIKVKELKSLLPKILDRKYRLLIFEGFGFRKANALFNLISHQPDIDKYFLYAKDPFRSIFQLLITKREAVGLKHYNDFKTFIES